MQGYRRKHRRNAPRGWWSLFFRLGGWAALVLGAGLFVLTLFSAGALYLAGKVDREGALAYAAVAAKREGVDGAHYVTFTYKVRGGGGRSVEKKVPQAYFDAVQPGDERPVRYLADRPGRIEEDIGYYRRIGVRLRWIGLAVGLAGLAALWLFGKRANRAVRVRRDGERRLADVIGIRDANVVLNDIPQGRLQWREPDGRTGESLLHDAAWLRRTWGPGDSVAVYRLGRLAYWEGDVGPPAASVSAGLADSRAADAGHRGESG